MSDSRRSALLPAALCVAMVAALSPAARARESLAVAPAAQPSTAGPTQAELDAAETAGGNWLTYNKGYLGGRYAPLSTITAANAGKLKIICRASLGTQGAFQDGPIVYNGILYAQTATATTAIDAATCKTIWNKPYALGPAASTSTKGVALAAGRLIRGTGDGHLIALDARTGALLWNRQIADPGSGEFAVAAPLVWNDTVFIGKSGAEYGIRGAIMAFSAIDGHALWTFNTIPGPGDTGGDTWGSAASIAHGGGSTWTTTSLDEATGTLLVPVGNPGPDFTKALRPGANLFTNSLVALDARTGALKWWHQLLQGDDRDWDTSVTAAFDAKGARLAAAAGKDGLLHVVDRATGALRFTARLVDRYVNTTTAVPAGAGLRLCPIGAVQWNGPAYSPATNLLYMTGIDWCAQAIKGAAPTYKKGQMYLGWSNFFGTREARSSAYGLISALDPATGATRWRVKSASLPLGGLVATAGGLLLAGGTDGHLLALDAATGAARASVDLGAPIGGGIVTYTAAGQQRIAVAAGHTSATFGTSGQATIVVLGLP